MRSISSPSTAPKLLRPSYAAYPVRLDDHDHCRELFLSVIAPVALHGLDVASLIEDAVGECCAKREKIKHGQATAFDLLAHFERALDSRGLQVCRGHRDLMHDYDTETSPFMH